MPSRAQRLEPHGSVQPKRAEGARGRPEDLQWVKPHCPHPGACHLPQAGIAVESHLSTAAPPEPLEGRQGPIWGQEAGKTCSRTSGKINGSARPAPAPAGPSGGWLHERPTHAGPSGWNGGGRVSARGQRPDSDGDSTPTACLPGAPHPVGPTRQDPGLHPPLSHPQ